MVLFKELDFIILAGGESRRMGEDKKFVRFRGKSFLEIVIEKAKACVDESRIIISVSKGESSEVMAFLKRKRIRGFKVIEDEIPYKGPLFACWYACKQAEHSYTALLSVDCILADMRFYRIAYEALRKFNADAAVLNLGKPNACFGVYKTKALLNACEKAIEQGKDKLSDVLDFLDYVFIDEKEIERENIDKGCFVSINSKSMLEEVKKYGKA